MSIAPRVSGTNQNSNVSTNGSKGGQLTGIASSGNQGSNPSSNSNICSSGAYMSLLNSGIAVPRQVSIQARNAVNDQNYPIHLSFTGTIGQGTFGQIEKATLVVPYYPDSGNNKTKQSKESENIQVALQVAVKRVLQDPRYKNRELSIMQKLKTHPNIVEFYFYYYSTASSNNRSHRSGNNRSSSSSGLDVYLHLVLECFPESLCELIYRYSHRNSNLPNYIVKVFTYQMLKALAYLHSLRICHRDIKSSNLLVNESTAVLKVCDFGSAKEMVPGTSNVSYISSRYYRAPELLFGAQVYTCAIDTWSAGCVLAEMLRQRCLFMGGDSVDQLVKVIRVLGTPTPQDISSMNASYNSYSFPDVQPCPVKLFFPQHTTADLLNLMSKMLVYNPTLRIMPSQALSEQCFDELREIGPNGLLPNRVRMPSCIFDPDPPQNQERSIWPPDQLSKKIDLSAIDKRSKQGVPSNRNRTADHDGSLEKSISQGGSTGENDSKSNDVHKNNKPCSNPKSSEATDTINHNVSDSISYSQAEHGDVTTAVMTTTTTTTTSMTATTAGNTNNSNNVNLNNNPTISGLLQKSFDRNEVQ